MTVMQKPHTRQFRRVLLALLSVVLLLKSRDLALEGWLKADDFVAYWAAARLQGSGQNPYSNDELIAVQRPAGWTDALPLPMYNPPWTLCLTLPFGFFPYSTARVLWLFLNVGSVVFAVDWALRHYGNSLTPKPVYWGLSALFLPALMAVHMGQSSPVLLLGIVGFLSCERQQRGVMAGAALLMLAIKPHLFYIFWLAFVFWTLDRRRWDVLAGSGLAILGATSFALYFNPVVLAQYVNMIQNQAPPLLWLTPTPGTFLRLHLGPTKSWVQFVPMFAGVAWFVFHWRRRRHTWEWSEEMPVLLLASLATTSFAWMFDQVVLLPFIVQALGWVLTSRDRRLKVLALGGYVLINALLLILIAFKTEHSYYVWLAPVWLAGYLFLRARVQPTRGDAMSLTGIRDSVVG